MLTLAIETSLRDGSIALVSDGQLLGTRGLDPLRRSAQTLIPAIADLLHAAGVSAKNIDLVAVTIGPGSFTGLRVAVTTAKTFAYAAACDVIGLDTLDVIAAQVPTHLVKHNAIHAALDAQRQELFVAKYRGRGGGSGTENPLERVGETRTVSIEAWISELRDGTVVTGPGIDRFEDRLPSGVIAVDAALRVPSAVTVARLANFEYERGRRDNLWKLAPVYIRPSAAEEKRGKDEG